MAFQKIEKQSSGSKPIQSVRLTVAKNGNVVFRIPQSLGAQVGFTVGGSVEFLIGTDRDAGKLALRGCQEGYILCIQKRSPGGALQLAVKSSVLGLKTDFFAMSTVEHEVVDDMLVLTVPQELILPGLSEVAA